MPFRREPRASAFVNALARGSRRNRTHVLVEKGHTMSSLVRFLAAIVLGFLTISWAPAQSRDQKRELTKITDRVYVASGYALGNTIFLLTDKSVVVVDTTESQEAARAILAEFRKISQLPVSYIIYTHNHGDHIRGAKVFKGAQTRIIAQKLLPVELAKYDLLSLYYRRVAHYQFGGKLPVTERGVSLALPIDGKTPVPPSGYLPPDILFDEEHKFEEGGVRFELYHTQGETPDHLMVWLPQEKVLLPGDLFYWSFPMLASPMKPDRPILEWAESLDRMRKLRPQYLVPSHWKGITGEKEIDTALANYARAIRYIHDETVNRLNQGLSLDEIRQQVYLPEELAKLPYLAPNYGTVAWGVEGVYRHYTGWYDFNPVRLNPDKSAGLHRALLEASGGPEALIKRGRRALSEGQPQLAVELMNIVLSVEPKHGGAHAVCAGAYQQLADGTTNTVAINIYRTAAQEHKKLAEK
jgi:alkyl sulfatase BDS1-like metallo-beta-lactamase superfamily hydrolase